MTNIMEYISYFFNDIATIPRLTVTLSIAFAAVVVFLFAGNLACGAMAKVRKTNGRVKKFFKKHDAIDYYNIKDFYKKCIAILPGKARKAWKNYELSGKPIENTQFELTVRESVAKGGAVGFGAYLYMYIAVMAVLVVAMMFSDMPQEISSIYVCVCLIVGAVGLFVLGMQLYIMDKKACVRLDGLVSMIYSKNRVYKSDKAKAVSVSSSQQFIANMPKVETVQQPIYSNLDRINQSINLEPKAAETLAIQTEEDCIGKLNVLVDKIIAQGGSSELLDSAHAALLAVYDAKFSKPLDELRIKCIIKKLEAVS